MEELNKIIEKITNLEKDNKYLKEVNEKRDKELKVLVESNKKIKLKLNKISELIKNNK